MVLAVAWTEGCGGFVVARNGEHPYHTHMHVHKQLMLLLPAITRKTLRHTPTFALNMCLNRGGLQCADARFVVGAATMAGMCVGAHAAT